MYAENETLYFVATDSFRLSEKKIKIEDKKGTAQLIFNNNTEDFQFQFDTIEEYAFVCALTK